MLGIPDVTGSFRFALPKTGPEIDLTVDQGGGNVEGSVNFTGTEGIRVS